MGSGIMKGMVSLNSDVKGSVSIETLHREAGSATPSVFVSFLTNEQSLQNLGYCSTSNPLAIANYSRETRSPLVTCKPFDNLRNVH